MRGPSPCMVLFICLLLIHDQLITALELIIRHLLLLPQGWLLLTVVGQQNSGHEQPHPFTHPIGLKLGLLPRFSDRRLRKRQSFLCVGGPRPYELTYSRPAEAGGGVEGGLGLLLRCSPAQARQGPRKHPNSWHPETFGIYFQIRYSFGLMAQQKPTQFTTPNRVFPGGGGAKFST